MSMQTNAKQNDIRQCCSESHCWEVYFTNLQLGALTNMISE